jgi:glutathione S-transferase
MRYHLFYAPGAASFAVHWMLIELGVPFTTTRLDLSQREQKHDEYLALNPSGQVPTLVIDGRPHAETAALLLLLAEQHPERGFAPPPGSPERAEFLQRALYIANTLQPAFRAWFYADEPAGPENAAAAAERARIAIEACWDRLAGILADGRAYLLGDRLTTLDFHTGMLMRWSRAMPRPAQSWPPLARYLETLAAMPSLRRVHEAEALPQWPV